MDTEKKPLGYISLLNNTQKAVYPMDDFFINYVFHKKENWLNLRDMINIFLDAYAEKYNKHDGFHFVDGDIIVETQYEHYLKKTTKQPSQDVKINEIKKENQTYVEFQNKTFSKPPIAIRASNYSGLAINKAKDGSHVSQIWLLAENDDNVLQGQAISNYRMREDNTGKYYPRDVNIMFVSLPELAKENSICGELSKLLIGAELDGVSGELKAIVEMFKSEYEIFKENEEVLQSMTVLEERFAEGIEEGRQEGIAIGEAKADEKYNTRHEKAIITQINNKMAYHSLKVLAMDIGVSDDRLNELLEKYKYKQKSNPVKSRSRDER